VNGLKSWANYLFPTLEGALDEIQLLVAENDITRKIASTRHGDVLYEDDRIYEKGNEFKSFHHHASQPMSRKALLAGFLSV